MNKKLRRIIRAGVKFYRAHKDGFELVGVGLFGAVFMYSFYILSWLLIG